MIKTWGTIIPSKYLYSNYDIDTADKLHMMELDFLINAGTLSHDFLEWAKENIPNIPMPKCYFVPLIEWLKTNNIKFKETLEKGEK